MKKSGVTLLKEVKEALHEVPTETLAEVIEIIRLYKVISYDCIQDTFIVEEK